MTFISQRLYDLLAGELPTTVTVILRHDTGARETLRSWIAESATATLVDDLPFDLLVVQLSSDEFGALVELPAVRYVGLDDPSETPTFQFVSLLSQAQHEANRVSSQITTR